MSIKLNQIDVSKTNYGYQAPEGELRSPIVEPSGAKAPIDYDYSWFSGFLSAFGCALFKNYALPHVVKEKIVNMALTYGDSLVMEGSEVAGLFENVLFSNRVLWGGMGALGGGLMAGLINYTNYSEGRISGARAILDTAINTLIGGAAGFLGAYAASAEIGATLGSFIPIPGAGTLIGTVIGVGVAYFVGKGLEELIRKGHGESGALSLL